MLCNIIDKYFLTLNSFLEDDKFPKDYGTGESLYSAEITFINAIYNNPESNAIELSKILNITRGAVTQYGNKLEEKNIIERYLKEGNKKEKYYRLTEEGNKIIDGYFKYHKDANDKICEYLSSLDHDEKKIILEFLDKMSELPITRFKCDCKICATTYI